MHVFVLFLSFFRKLSLKTYTQPDFSFINTNNGFLGIQNMGIDTKIRTLAIMEAKILKKAKIMAAILENGVCREKEENSDQAPKIFWSAWMCTTQKKWFRE